MLDNIFHNLQGVPEKIGLLSTFEFLGLGGVHRQAAATYAQLRVCSNYFSIPAIEYFLAIFNFYNNMEFNPSFTHNKLY